MNKLDGKTLDVTSKTIDSLKRECPEVFTDGKVDFEKLKLVLGENIETSNEKYEFKWNGKNDVIKLAQTPSMGTLRPDKDSSKNWDNTENLYIEGDNLEVLKLLQKSYFSKVKLIYIDVPYNTGKDFVYKDNFKDSISNYKETTNQKNKANTETNGRYHTEWLNMMYPRLKLARNLLKEDGLIFISIDDNEVANLKKICDEIFGEDNFISQIVVVSNPGGRDYGGVAVTHEYILAYKKTLSSKLKLINDSKKNFVLFDNIGGFELRELRNRNTKFNIDNRPNLYYPFYINENSVDNNNLYEISTEKKEGWVELFPLESQGIKTVWRWGKPKSIENLNINIKAKKMKNGGYQIVEKYREEKSMSRSVWSETEMRTENGSLMLKKIFSSKCFDYPKSVDLIKRICEMCTDKNDLIMDFFSGSSTTAHTIMQFNTEDGGNRKFIMVQLPEQTDEKSEAYKAGYKNICEIGKERIRRAGEKIVSETGKTDLDIGFKVFKLDDSNLKTWNPDYNELEKTLLDFEDNLKEDRTQEDLLYEILLKLGYELTSNVEEIRVNNKTIFKIENSLLVCLENDIDNEIVEHITKINTNTKELKIVFKESGFKSDKDKMNAAENLKQFGITNISFI